MSIKKYMYVRFVIGLNELDKWVIYQENLFTDNQNESIKQCESIKTLANDKTYKTYSSELRAFNAAIALAKKSDFPAIEVYCIKKGSEFIFKDTNAFKQTWFLNPDFHFIDLSEEDKQYLTDTYGDTFAWVFDCMRFRTTRSQDIQKLCGADGIQIREYILNHAKIQTALAECVETGFKNVADIDGNGTADGNVSNVANATPHSNTGGLTEETSYAASAKLPNQTLPEFLQELEQEEVKLQELAKISEKYAVPVMENGVLKEVMVRRGVNTPAFIDTLSFVISMNAFNYVDDDGFLNEFNDASAINGVVQFLEITGLSVMSEGNGRNGYQKSFILGDAAENRNYGFIAWGGNSNTIMYHLTGEGLASCVDGFEKALYLWFFKMRKYVKITRVDIAHDMLFGQYKIEQAPLDWANDKFTTRQTRPYAERQGVDWLSGTKKGRTFYIGSKKSSRILYFYEKGKQLGDENSEWVRVELRQRSKDFIIPLDVLLYAGDYLCTAYPYLSEILNYDFSEQYRFERIKKINGVAVEHVIKYAKMQVSPAIRMLFDLGLEPDEIVDKLFNDKAKLPKRLLLQKLKK